MMDMWTIQVGGIQFLKIAADERPLKSRLISNSAVLKSAKISPKSEG